MAAIVGTVLNLINQWGGLVNDAPIHYPKLLLTYVVPYLVSSITAWQAQKARTE